MTAVEEKAVSRVPVGLLSFSVGAIVANIYYVQPLLAEMAREFGVSANRIGLVAMLTQAGTALGMAIFVPLGDNCERRSLLTWLLASACAALCCVAAAPNLILLSAASFAVGACGAAVHVLVPWAAHLAPERDRGKVVGTVFSGLLMGILLARTFSGFAGALFGWRAVYGIAAAVMLSLLFLLRSKLPSTPAEHALPWIDLMRSIGRLVRQHAALRESTFIGAAMFCAFSAFWTTLSFFLQTRPYRYGPSVAGLFGLVGAAGALCAPVAGRLTDKRGPRLTILLALLASAAAFVLMAWKGTSLFWLIVGVILLDAGVQSGHVANQTRIYSLEPAARSRLNTVYMFCYFVGGAAGSYFGAICWSAAGWIGVCALATGALASAAVVYFVMRSQTPARKKPEHWEP